MRTISYPNALRDLVVVEYPGPGRVGLSFRPIEPGRYRVLVWPRGLPDPDLFRHAIVEFETANGPPRRVQLDLTDIASRGFRAWQWALVRIEGESTPIEDLARALWGDAELQEGRFSVRATLAEPEMRCMFWSCHQPYETDRGEAVMEDDALDILDWYRTQVSEFRPHLVWGGGDTAYSDGTGATNFVNEVFNRGGWDRQAESRAWLKNEYRRMYRHFWSLDPMREVLGSVPHLFTWDDHELRDGWGSEAEHFRGSNPSIYEIARDVAQEYILSAGPRVRGDGDAHQAFVSGPLASFIFDSRMSRNYAEGRLLSAQQFRDFRSFLDVVRRNPDVTDLVTCSSVPFVGLRTWVTQLITRAPDFLNDSVLEGVRDDVRDSWTSPGNLPTLVAVLRELTAFQRRRPDVRITNVSGDIHVAQAYEILAPGSIAPIRQVTSSAITNRTHPSDLIAALIEIAVAEIIPGVGLVRRLWPTISEPNVLAMRFAGGRAHFDLKVFNPDQPGDLDRSMKL